MNDSIIKFGFSKFTYFFLLFYASALSNIENKEVCNLELFDPDCGNNAVIIIESAFYGRMQLGRCVKKNYGNLGCMANVQKDLDGICSGYQSCSLKIPQDDLHRHLTCSSDLTPYLQVSYRCLNVIQKEAYSQACMTGNLIKIEIGDNPSAYELIYSSTQHDNKPCSWLVQAQQGQKINVTLWDFEYSNINQNEYNDNFGSRCLKYAVIKEKREGTTSTTICSSHERIKNIYISKLNQLEIYFMPAPGNSKKASFLLQFNVIGCPDPILKSNTLLERSSSKAVFICGTNGHKTNIYCNENKWNAEVPQCYLHSEGNTTLWKLLSEDWSTPKGVAITVAIGVALGTVIGVILLSCVLICLKRYNKSHNPNGGTYLGNMKSSDADRAIDAMKWNTPTDVPETQFNTYRSRISIKNTPDTRWTTENEIIENITKTHEQNQNRILPTDFPPSSHLMNYRTDYLDHVYEKPL